MMELKLILQFPRGEGTVGLPHPRDALLCWFSALERRYVVHENVLFRLLEPALFQRLPSQTLPFISTDNRWQPMYHERCGVPEEY